MIPYSRIGNLKNHILSRGSSASAPVQLRTWTFLGLVQPVNRFRPEGSGRGWKGPEGSELAEIEVAAAEGERGGMPPPPLSLSRSPHLSSSPSSLLVSLCPVFDKRRHAGKLVNTAGCFNTVTPLLSDRFSKIFQVNSLYLEPLVSDHLS